MRKLGTCFLRYKPIDNINRDHFKWLPLYFYFNSLNKQDILLFYSFAKYEDREKSIENCRSPEVFFEYLRTRYNNTVGTNISFVVNMMNALMIKSIG
jgi:hypothetical protein